MSKCTFDITPDGPYFSIIRSAIWNTSPDTSNWFQHIDWKPILNNYSEQAILPLVGDILTRLPRQYELNVELSDQLFLETITVTRAHLKTRQTYNDIFHLLTSNGLTPILLKGETLAALYPNPNLRSCGDIDIYITPPECGKALRLLCGSGATYIGDSGQHHQLRYNGITIELHHHLGEHDTFRGIPGIRAKTQSLLLTDLAPSNPTQLKLGQTSIPCYTLSPQTEALFLFLHLSKHLIGSGIGLRQFIDQALFLHSITDKYSKDLFLAHVKHLRYEKTWNMIATVMVHYLGLPPNECPRFKPLKPSHTAYLIKYLVEVGDFARYDIQRKSIHNVGLIPFLFVFLRRARLNIRFFPKRFFISINEALSNVK